MSLLKLVQENWITLSLSIVGLLLLLRPLKGRTGLSIGVDRQGVDGTIVPAKSGPSLTSRVTELSSADPAFEAVLRALSNGNKIEAIKILREAKDLDLKTAKDMVEAIERNRGIIRA